MFNFISKSQDKMDKNKIVDNLIKITKIKLDENAKEEATNQIYNLIKLGKEINNLVENNEDIKNAQPMYNVQDWLGNYDESLREDVVDNQSYCEDIIDNAPDKEEVFIAVPKIIE